MNSKSKSISKNLTHFCHFVETDYQLTFQLKMSEKHRTALEMFQPVSLLYKWQFTKYRKTPLFVAPKRYLLARERAQAGTFHPLALLGKQQILVFFLFAPKGGRAGKFQQRCPWATPDELGEGRGEGSRLPYWRLQSNGEPLAVRSRSEPLPH